MNERQKTILAELRTQYEEGLKAWDAVDGKLIAVFTAAGFILALFIAIKPEAVSWHLLQFTPYLGMVILILIGLWPRTLRSPIRLDWETIWKLHLNESDENSYQQLIGDYLDAFAANDRRGKCKARLLVGAMLLLAIQVAIAVISLLWGCWA